MACRRSFRLVTRRNRRQQTRHHRHPLFQRLTILLRPRPHQQRPLVSRERHSHTLTTPCPHGPPTRQVPQGRLLYNTSAARVYDSNRAQRWQSSRQGVVTMTTTSNTCLQLRSNRHSPLVSAMAAARTDRLAATRGKRRATSAPVSRA